MSDTLSIVMPAVTPAEAQEAWKAYEALKSSIVDRKTDIQVIQGKEFLKKSYWRKVATFFNLTVEVVNETHEQIGKTVVWHFTCKAVAPNGRSSVGVGSCDAYEKAIKGEDGVYRDRWNKLAVANSLHNIRSTVETRAFNRAVSNLVGGGEVSADEVASPSDAQEDHLVDSGQLADEVSSGLEAQKSTLVKEGIKKYGR